MKIHIVKKGDTLYKLSQKYHVDLQKLIEANPQIANPDVIDVGMKVKIPANAQPVKLPENMIAYKHVVKQGDTLWKLSKEWGVPLHTLIQANPQLKNPNVLLTGEVVNIPKIGVVPSNNQPHSHSPTAVQSNPGINQPAHPAAEENIFEMNMQMNEISIGNPPETSKKVTKENMDPFAMGNSFMQAPAENAKKVEDLFAQYKIPATEASVYTTDHEMPYLSAAYPTNMNSPMPPQTYGQYPANMNSPMLQQTYGQWPNAYPNVSSMPYMQYPYGCGQTGANPNLSMTQPYGTFADPSYPGAGNSAIHSFPPNYSAPYGMPYTSSYNAPLNTGFGNAGFGNAGFGNPYPFPLTSGYSDPFMPSFGSAGANPRGNDDLANTGMESGRNAQETEEGEANIKQLQKKSAGSPKSGAKKRQTVRGQQRRAKSGKTSENLPWINK